MFEDTKGVLVIRNHKWKDIHINYYEKKDKRTNNEIQNTIQKTKD